MTREEFITRIEAIEGAFRRFLVALCCGDTTLADDIAQETFMKAFIACDTLKDPEKFKSWIFRIGHTTFLSHLRSEKAHEDYEATSHIASADSADSEFRYQDLYTALNMISEKERYSLLLFYMEGYSIKEISAIINATESAVKQHLSRGRNHLRTLLSNM